VFPQILIMSTDKIANGKLIKVGSETYQIECRL